jgi:ADP-ribosylglycohydrolase
MRAAVLGVYAWKDPALLPQLVRASTRLTHADPAAEHGALAVALAAAYGMGMEPDAIRPAGFLSFVGEHLAGTPMMRLLQTAARSVEDRVPFSDFLEANGCGRGVSGYINHTLPAAIFCWLRWPGDFRTAVEQMVMAGGDADTTGAIVGALVGATTGARAIPQEWLDGLMEWPRTAAWMRKLANTLPEGLGSEGASVTPVPLFWPGLLVRNLFFLGVVLTHGFRRILPPY